MQELLRHYRASEEPKSHRSRGSRESTPTETNTLFLELPYDIQSVVRPYLDSKFQLQTLPLRATGVIFKPDMSFRRWLASWMRQLIENHASGMLAFLWYTGTGCRMQNALHFSPECQQNAKKLGVVPLYSLH